MHRGQSGACLFRAYLLQSFDVSSSGRHGEAGKGEEPLRTVAYDTVGIETVPMASVCHHRHTTAGNSRSPRGLGQGSGFIEPRAQKERGGHVFQTRRAWSHS